MSTNVCVLLAVCVVVCVIYLAPVVSQCTTEHCHDDANNVNALTVMVYQLQDTVEQQQVLLEQQQNQSALVYRLQDTVKRQQDSLEQQQNQLTTLRETVEQQQNQLTTLSETVEQQQKQLRSQVEVLREFLPVDCAGHLKKGHSTSGVYFIRLAGRVVQVYCDMTTDGGGWLVFQRRVDNTTDFYRDWNNYKEGFGDLTRNFWLGNDNLHAITAQKNYSLRIDLGDFEGATTYVEYSYFAVANEDNNYRLTLRGSHSSTGMHFQAHSNGREFTTRDRDNDNYDGNCAENGKGAWWYLHCGPTNLNGMYLGGANSSNYQGVNFYPWRSGRYSLKTADMKLRPQ